MSVHVFHRIRKQSSYTIQKKKAHYYSECNYALEKKKKQTLIKIYENKIQTIFVVEQIDLTSK